VESERVGKCPQKEKRPRRAAMGAIAAFAVNFYHKDTAPGPYRYREVSTPLHREGKRLP